MTADSTELGAMPTRISAVVLASTPSGQPVLGVVGKRTYTVFRGILQEAPSQIPLVEQPILCDDEGGLRHDSDLIMNRTGVDVVIQGHAYDYEGKNWFTAAIGAGAFQRRLLVFGDRRCEVLNGAIRFTAPAPITKIPLLWESAYGGVDEVARKALGGAYEDSLKSAGVDVDPRFGPFGYPRNPVGKGYLIDPSLDAVAACHLPNLEDPEHVLLPQNLARGDFLRWPTGPKVASFGWLPYNYFPRSAQIGLPLALYDYTRLSPADFVEVREKWVRVDTVAEPTTMPDRRDVRMCQSSAIGMRADVMMDRTRVELLNLHPNERLWTFALPAAHPQIGVRLPGKKAEELQPKLRTLLIEPDQDRVCLVWGAELLLDVPPPPRLLEQVQHVIVWKH